MLSGSRTAHSDDIVPLTKGQEAPFAGVLFSHDKALGLKKTMIENDELKLINASFARSIDLYKSNEESFNEKVNLLSTRNDELSRSLIDSRESSTWEKLGWFLGGAIVTGLSVYGAARLAK